MRLLAVFWRIAMRSGCRSDAPQTAERSYCPCMSLNGGGEIAECASVSAGAFHFCCCFASIPPRFTGLPVAARLCETPFRAKAYVGDFFAPLRWSSFFPIIDRRSDLL